MLPQVPIIRVTDSEKIPMPSYVDGVGTSMILRSNEMKSIKIAPKHFEVFSTGFAVALPVGLEAQIRSLKESTKNGIIVLNAPATIDASDRQEIKVCLFNASQESIIVKQGDPIAMMVFSMALRIQWADLTHRNYKEMQSMQKRSEPEEVSVSLLSDGPGTESEVSEEQDVIEPVARLEEEQIQDDISEENSLIDDAVAPPAMLEEFEKIESNFEENKAPEGTN